jgi:hypothetical protein
VTLRIRLLALLLALGAAPLPAQLVGTLPSESPFTDASGRHIVSMFLGYLSSVSDPAGVGPQGSAMLAASYDYDFPGAFFLTTRMGLAPSSKRTVIDPLFDGPQRIVGSTRDALFLLDAGLGASLTGEKAWRGISPRVVTSIGYLGALDPDYDIGQYRFGSKFAFSLGLNLRGVTGQHWEWRADLTRSIYRMNYPALYRDGSANAGDPVIPGTTLNPWTGQTFLSVGIARVWGR